MIANIVIILFLVAMACWWGYAQGLFNAFVHAIATVIAASLAVALWEPLTMGWLIYKIPDYAWAIGLLVPFVLWLTILRILSARVGRRPIAITRSLDTIGGGVCGFVAGVLTAGITVLGIGFLPLPADTGGYQPIKLHPNGRVSENPTGSLWLPVERYAESFLATLSRGAFSTPLPLAQYQPRLTTQATLLRMQREPHHSIAADPDSIRVTDVYAAALPVQGLDKTTLELLGPTPTDRDMMLVVVDTVWRQSPVSYEKDNSLRIAPTQVRLVCWQPHDNTTIRLHPPVAWVHRDRQNNKRILKLFVNNAPPASGDQADEMIGWVFTVPRKQWPYYILARHLRLWVVATHGDPDAMAYALGRPQPPESPTETQVTR